jgi:hypothetical protein
MTHDREELRLRFFEIAFANRLQCHARGGVESQSKAAQEAARLAGAAVDAFLDDAPTPDYPWHLAPEGTVGAATDEDGDACFWSGEPQEGVGMWFEHDGAHELMVIPNFTLPGDWRESWRWMPGKEPKP